MKWLFTLLILVNLAILGWGFQRDPDAALNMQRVPPGVGNLQLLAEVGSNPVNPDKAVAAGVSSDVAGATSTGPEQAQAVRGEAQPAPLPEIGSVMPQEPDLAEKPVPGPASTGKPIDSELTSPTGPKPEKPQRPEPAPPVCGAFGPFERGAEARALAESLASQGMDTSLRRESMDKPIGYWVMIPPLQNQEAAIEKVKQLRESGIQDIRRFVKGDQKNGISLGVFSKQGNAQSRQQEIASKGHRAEVVPRLITVPTYWVDYRSDQARVDRAASRLSESREGIKNEQYPCSRVVTSGGIF